MHHSDLASHFRTVETMLGELIVSVGPVLTAEEIAYLHDIIAHSEYGDAFENLAALLVDKRATLDGSQIQRLNALRDLMGADNAPVAEALLVKHGRATNRGAADEVPHVG